ncbi:hypothetical protein [Humibacillus xanthopallidus]|uniref:Uncharacterized protein n=1 Tax=Humibacillus xanthopallidus TaxID=412689 RepID=A0A543I3I4_9MICO|nr:hypothetical protein [Humibacillus xanthopallidus]TQM65135.1 hypothetical protein FBY41_1520 [Humibacillus xanthopallidus]
MATQDQGRPRAVDLAPVPRAAPLRDEDHRALYCPECGMPTWVEWRDGDHVKLRCFSRHWFLMLAERLC